MKPIVTYPDPILLQEAEVVTFPLDGATKNLIKDMWATVRDEGVGIAAPQVGVSKKICIIHLSETERGRDAKDIVMINPIITFFSEVECEMIEGCLSFPGDYYSIIRPANIMVEYFNENGKKQKLRARNWLARVIQHEVDHLNGKVFIKHPTARQIDVDKLKDEVVVD